MPKHVAVHLVDALEDAQAPGDDHLQLEAESQRKRARERTTAFEQLPGSLRLER